MSRKNTSYSYQVNKRKDSQIRSKQNNNSYKYASEDSDSELDKTDYKKIRVIQKNLVYAIGLTQSISTTEMLQSSSYFGRYGKVLKIILNKASTPSKNQRYTSYVTYSNELEASLAVLALDDYEIGARGLKVSYGTTKYCSYFLKKQQCPNIRDCYFLHKWDYQNEITVDDNSKQVFNKQIKIAMKIVSESIDELIKKFKQKKEPQKQSEFPDIKYAINILYENNYISKQKLNCFIDANNQNKIQNSVLTQNSSDQEGSYKKKCKSISTAPSPIKSEEEIPKKQDDFNCKSPKSEVQEVQNLIQKLILKAIMNQNSESKSRLKFIESKQINSHEETRKIKKYMDMYFIPKNSEV